MAARWRCPGAPVPVCDLCSHVMTGDGDCLNPECVASARLPRGDEYTSGTWHADGAYSGRRADGTCEGTMRVHFVDAEWARQVMDWVRVRAMAREGLGEIHRAKATR